MATRCEADASGKIALQWWARGAPRAYAVGTEERAFKRRPVAPHAIVSLRRRELSRRALSCPCRTGSAGAAASRRARSSVQVCPTTVDRGTHTRPRQHSERNFPISQGRLTHVQLLFTWNPSPLRSTKFSFVYLLLPPRSAPRAAPRALARHASTPPTRPPTRRSLAFRTRCSDGPAWVTRSSAIHFQG